jgi:pyrroloquinoline quinone biosynthesis protein E
MNNNQIYPALKPTTRIKKLPGSCWIIEPFSDEDSEISPSQSFLLSLCTGELSLQGIVRIFADTLGIASDAATAFANATITRVQNSIDWLSHPALVNSFYDPGAFLYDPKPSALDSQQRLETPCEMLVSITHKCNFRCIYCFNASGKSLSGELETGEWLDVIRQAHELGILKCTISGGEPMLYPGFFEIVEALLDSGIIPYVCTNGSMINKHVVSRFKDMGLPFVQISMDTASEELHDRLTQAPASFPAVVGAIEELTDSGIPVFVKSVLTSLNIGNVEKLIDLCSSIGVRKLVLDRFDVSSCGRGNAELLVSDRQMEEIRQLVQSRKGLNNDSFSVKAVAHPQQWKTENDIIPCAALRRSFTVMANGDVCLCEKMLDVPNMSIGNIRKMSILDIWNSPSICQLINPDRDKISATCRGCQYIERCGTGCFAIKNYLHLPTYAIDPRCWNASFIENPYAKTIDRSTP